MVCCSDNRALLSLAELEFTEATRITGGLSKHRQMPYNAYYDNN